MLLTFPFMADTLSQPTVQPMQPALPSPHYFLLARPEALSEVLRGPATLFIEYGPHHLTAGSLRGLQEYQPHFGVSLSCATACDSSICEIIAVAIEQRFLLHQRQHMDIRTCLQEAMANAIIHGNLALGSAEYAPDGLSGYHTIIRERIQQEPYRHMRVEISAWRYPDRLSIGVTDQGAGIPDCCLHTQPNKYSCCGRGLMLIHSLAKAVQIGEKRNMLIMDFEV